MQLDPLFFDNNAILWVNRGTCTGGQYWQTTCFFVDCRQSRLAFLDEHICPTLFGKHVTTGFGIREADMDIFGTNLR